MNFVTLEFVVFFLVVFVSYWSVPRRTQNLGLVVAGLVFYGWVHPWWVLLLLYSAILDFSCGLAIARWPARRGRFLALSVLGNVGLLGMFKYFDFFVENTVVALRALGVHTDLHTLGLLLPAGISFFTFQTLSYTIDVYRGRLAARTDPLEFLTFVTFFPPLMAGPIERAGSMLPQIETPRTLTASGLSSGLCTALWGAFKKVVVADSLAPFVAALFEHPHPSGPMVWAAAFGFVIQMFADFSGYTDIARGTARMLGFELIENFREPFLARTPFELWERWHISYSSWVRDYLFHPLALSRFARRWLVPPFVRVGGRFHLYRALLLTTMISGLWHGASWNFVLWGALFGALQIGFHVGAQWVPATVSRWRYASWALLPVMGLVHLSSGMLFREGDLDRILLYFSRNPFMADEEGWIAATAMTSLTLVACVPLIAGWVVHRRLPAAVLDHPAWVPARAALVVAGAACIYVFAQPVAVDFVYYQF